MGQDTSEAGRDWLQEDDAHGFQEEVTPATPVVSVTVTPKGRCYHIAKDIIARLARVKGDDEDESEPHITIQGVYDDTSLEPVVERLAWVAAGMRPFCVNITGLGLLSSPTYPDLMFLHLHVEKSPELVELYTAVKDAIDALGLRTYPYTPEEWVPHLTLASGRWSRRDLHDLLQEVGPKLPVCILPVDEIQINRLDQVNGWRCVDRLTLGAEGSATG